MQRRTALRWTKLGLFTCVLVALHHMLLQGYVSSKSNIQQTTEDMGMMGPTKTSEHLHNVNKLTIVNREHANSGHLPNVTTLTNGRRKHSSHFVNKWVRENARDQLSTKQVQNDSPIEEKNKLWDAKAESLNKGSDISVRTVGIGNTSMPVALRHIRNCTLMDKILRTKPQCWAYLEDLHRPWRIVHNVLPTETTCTHCVTWTTHFAANRVGMLLRLLRHWTGPISVAILVEEAKLEHLVQQIQSASQGRVNVNATIVLQDGTYYPSNLMRNIAQEQVQTDFVFICDVDFLPMNNSEDAMAKHAGSMTHTMLYVVPAFEFTSPAMDAAVFLSKPHLLEAVRAKKPGVIGFRQNVFSPAHGPTDYATWYNTSAAYKIRFKQLFEPYVLLRTSSLKAFAEIFLGRGYNKSQWFYKLDKMKYSMHVMPDVYVIHVYHRPPQKSKEQTHCTPAVWFAWKHHADSRSASQRTQTNMQII